MNGPDRIRNRLHFLVDGAQTLLDVGSGPGTYTSVGNVPVRIALDANIDALDKVTDNHVICVCDNAKDALARWVGEVIFDVVIALDFIEHMTKKDALRVIDNMKRLAKRIVLFTPAGFMPQHLEGQPWQEHLSGWTADELSGLGFAVEEWKDFDYGIKTPHNGGLWATWDRSV